MTIAAIVNAVIPPVELPAGLWIERADWGEVVRLKPGTAPRGAEVEARVEDLEILRVEVRG